LGGRTHAAQSGVCRSSKFTDLRPNHIITRMPLSAHRYRHSAIISSIRSWTNPFTPGHEELLDGMLGAL